jgi:hypothetical protein
MSANHSHHDSVIATAHHLHRGSDADDDDADEDDGESSLDLFANDDSAVLYMPRGTPQHRQQPQPQPQQQQQHCSDTAVYNVMHNVDDDGDEDDSSVYGYDTLSLADQAIVKMLHELDPRVVAFDVAQSEMQSNSEHVDGNRRNTAVQATSNATDDGDQLSDTDNEDQDEQLESEDGLSENELQERRARRQRLATANDNEDDSGSDNDNDNQHSDTDNEDQDEQLESEDGLSENELQERRARRQRLATANDNDDDDDNQHSDIEADHVEQSHWQDGTVDDVETARFSTHSPTGSQEQFSSASEECDSEQYSSASDEYDSEVGHVAQRFAFFVWNGAPLQFSEHDIASSGGRVIIGLKCFTWPLDDDMLAHEQDNVEGTHEYAFIRQLVLVAASTGAQHTIVPLHMLESFLVLHADFCTTASQTKPLFVLHDAATDFDVIRRFLEEHGTCEQVVHWWWEMMNDGNIRDTSVLDMLIRYEWPVSATEAVAPNSTLMAVWRGRLALRDVDPTPQPLEHLVARYLVTLDPEIQQELCAYVLPHCRMPSLGCMLLTEYLPCTPHV